MATVVDRLVTQFIAEDARRYQQSLEANARATKRLADEERNRDQQSRRQQQIFDERAATLQATVAQYVSIAAAIELGRRALDEFTETERIAFAARGAFQGTSGLLGRINELAEATSRLTGVDDELILSQARLLFQMGATEAQIKRLTPLILDLAAANPEISADDATRAVIQGILGRTRALRALGIEYQATGNRAQDLLALERALQREVGATAAAGRGEIFGRRQALATEIGNRLSDLGAIIDQRTRGVQEAAIRGLQDPGVVDRFLTLLNNVFPQFRSLIPDPLTPAERAAEEERKNRAARGRGGDPAVRAAEAAEQTAQNTKAQLQLMQQGFGPTGIAGIRAGNIRALRASIRSGL